MRESVRWPVYEIWYTGSTRGTLARLTDWEVTSAIATGRLTFDSVQNSPIDRITWLSGPSHYWPDCGGQDRPSLTRSIKDTTCTACLIRRATEIRDAWRWTSWHNADDVEYLTYVLGDRLTMLDRFPRESVLDALKFHLSDDLRKAPWKGSVNVWAGYCYVVAEALYHMGLKDRGWKPAQLTHEGASHWVLMLADDPEFVLDPTVLQFETVPDYTKARFRGFLTKGPSTRAHILMERMYRSDVDRKEGIFDAS